MNRLLPSLLLLLAAPLAAQAPDTTRPSLIPWPASYRADTGRWLPGRSFTFAGPTGVTAEARRATSQARDILQESFGIPARTVAATARAEVTVHIRPGPDSSGAGSISTWTDTSSRSSSSSATST